MVLNYVDIAFQLEIISTVIIIFTLVLALEGEKFLWWLMLFPITFGVMNTGYFIFFPPFTNISSLLYLGYFSGLLHTFLLVFLIWIFIKSYKATAYKGNFINKNKELIIVFIILWIFDFLIEGSVYLQMY